MSPQGPNSRKVAQRRSAQPGRRPEKGRQFQPANTEHFILRSRGLDVPCLVSGAQRIGARYGIVRLTPGRTGVLYGLPRDPRAVREERATHQPCRPQACGAKCFACFLPVFCLVCDRLIACTGSSGYSRLGLHWKSARPPRSASRAPSYGIPPWSAALADRVAASKPRWRTAGAAVPRWRGGPPARWRSPGLMADDRR